MTEGDLREQFSLQMTNLENDVMTLEASRNEIKMIEFALRAGKDTDPVFRHATDEETEALHQIATELLKKMQGDTVSFSFSKREFLNMSAILEVVNTMDHEIYYPEMVDEFPSNDELDAFTQHVSSVYDRASHDDGRAW